ncbi:MAG: hypothetical protein WD042_00805 [Phycisphaeraceae bacterium]
MAFNRDELRTRGVALPPVIRDIGGRRVIMPVDPDSAGTWLAVNDAGVILGLLNVNLLGTVGLSSVQCPGLWAACGFAQAHDEPAPPAVPTGAQSRERLQTRGGIIPSLIDAGDAEAAAATAGRIDPALYPPFRLVIVDRRRVHQVVSDGSSLRVDGPWSADEPRVFASSGLGDHLVEGPRRELFEAMVVPHPQDAAAQDAYHRHRWPDRPHLSVNMDRPDARTVSRAAVELTHDRVTMSYHADPGDTGPGVVVELPLRRRA